MTERAGRAHRPEVLHPGCVGILDSTHLAELGWSERGTRAVWRTCGVELPEFGRKVVPVASYLAVLEGHAYVPPTPASHAQPFSL